ncbi:hypothetical protein F5Y07DRAFT_340665 [Xylaria sp. FL0933]|nr:hypothetical protein F5Y07DRAFT_340665 [Xylaria sp. FL0933]
MLTTLSIAASCLTETWLMSVPTGTDMIQHSAIVLGKPDDPNCWPGTRDLTTTISPAICPSGYVSACDITDASRRDESETVWACCPSGFRCDHGTWSCLAKTTNTYTVTYLDFQGKTTTSVTSWDSGVNAHSVRVAFHSSDILNLVTPTSSSPGSNTAPTQTSPSLFATTTSDQPLRSHAGGLSAGAGIGIGVAIAVGAIGLLAGIVWLARRQRRKKQQLSDRQEDAPLPQRSKASYASDNPPIIRPAELFDLSGVHELETEPPHTGSATGRPVA